MRQLPNRQKKDFNPRSREGSDQNGTIEIKVTGKFQSTLPRRERRKTPLLFLECYRISIHAPAKGATGREVYVAYGKNISIHAPAKGATCAKASNIEGIVISIHAPAKGATDV